MPEYSDRVLTSYWANSKSYFICFGEWPDAETEARWKEEIKSELENQ